MRLEYTTEPTETMTVTTPIGSTYTIPIWRPIGERSKPVMVEVAPERMVWSKKRRQPKRRVYIYQRVADFIKRMGRGCTTREINEALGRTKPLDELLREHTNIFYTDEKRVLIPIVECNGKVREKAFLIWYVYDSYNEKESN